MCINSKGKEPGKYTWFHCFNLQRHPIYIITLMNGLNMSYYFFMGDWWTGFWYCAFTLTHFAAIADGDEPNVR